MPGGALHRLPLHAALLPDGQPLIERYPTILLGSAHLAAHLDRRLDTPPEPSNQARLVMGPAHLKDHSRWLRWADRETRWLAQTWKDDPDARLAFETMTLQSLKQHADGRLAVLHLATHARFDESDYLQSHLEFYQQDLSVNHLISDAAYDLQGVRLCYLSSCESGRAQAGREEDLQGLVWALTYAGAEAVVASLWGVDDKVSYAMTQAFYGGLEAGRTLAEAYQDAVEELRAAGYVNPRYWAPFVLFGNGYAALEPAGV